jgi:hypothetical protein
MDKQLFYKLIIAIPFAALLPLIHYIQALRKTVNSFPVSVLLLTRLSIFFVIYFVLHQQVPSDVFSYYYPQARQVLDGLIPYRDFSSSYGIFFAYLNAGLLYIWDSPKVIVLFAILVEALTFYGWLRIINSRAKNILELFILLYIFNPLCLLNVAIAGQNQISIAFFLLLLVYLKLKDRPFISGAVGALSACVIKFLSVLFLPAFFFVSRNRWTFVLGAVLIGALYFIIGQFLHADIFLPFTLEKKDFTSGNLMYLVGGLSSFITGYSYESLFKLMDLIFYGSLLGVLFFLWKKVRKDSFGSLTLSLAIIVLTLMLFSKKSYTNYLVIAWIPLLISILWQTPSIKMVIHLVIFNVLCALEPSFWYRLVGQESLDKVLRQPGLKPWIFVLMELFMISYMIYYFAFFLNSIKESKPGPIPEIAVLPIKDLEHEKK